MSTEKKQCLSCSKSKPLNQFYRTNNEVLFSDGRYHTCNVCTREKVGEESGVKLSTFLHEINRPFLSTIWEKSKEKKGHTLGEYLRTISSTPDYMNLSYNDSDVKLDIGKYDVAESRPHIYDKEGVIIVLDEDLRAKWRRHSDEYTADEVLELELYCRNMKYDYEIETTAKESMLQELAVLNVKKNQLLKDNEIADYEKISRVFKNTMSDAGFRPIDKKDNLEKTGIDSVGEIVAQIERDGGFIAPRRVDYEPDDIDKMLTYYVQWAQRFNNETVATEVIDEWREIDDSQVEFGVDSTANEDYEESHESESDD